MRKLKKILWLSAVIVMSLPLFPWPDVRAVGTPDLSATGSISVTLACEGTAVPGGTLVLYRVGDLIGTGGEYGFVLTEEFENSGMSLMDPGSVTLAESLADYVSEKSMVGTEIAVGEDGTAKYANLTVGLYLVVQSLAAEGYETISPFLVSIPLYEDGTYIYDVDASPKVSGVQKTSPTEPENPTDPKKPNNPNHPGTPTTPENPSPIPSTPSQSGTPTLPQTGQLKWPVPVLASLGLCLFLLGFWLRLDRT